MKIVQLHAENFKRLGVVEITPEGNLVTIGGKNGHGKSSVLDAIYVALKGRAVAPPQPIRKGEEKCTIRLDMGEWIVTRNFHAKEGGEWTDTLKIENPDGLRPQKPQQTLDALLGEIGFDPFAFVNLKPDEQVAKLLDMVPLTIDIDEFAELDASDMIRRRDINREAAALKAQIEAIPREDVPEDVPDRDALTDQLGNAANTNAAIERERVHREQAKAGVERMFDEASKLEERAAELRRQAEAAEQDAAKLKTDASDRDDELKALPPLGELVDTDAIREQLRTADAVLALIDRQNRREALRVQWDEKVAASKALTESMAERAETRNKALAEAEMPVEGLGLAISENGKPVLTFEGLPFEKDQISTAVQLRVSTAIGMATNPRLRVLRISDGSLLDEDSMKLLAEMAEAEDFQLWVEVVGTGGTGIIMENGLVRGSEAADGNQDDSTAEPVQDAAKSKPKAKKAKAGEVQSDNEGTVVNSDKPEGGLL